MTPETPTRDNPETPNRDNKLTRRIGILAVAATALVGVGVAAANSDSLTRGAGAQVFRAADMNGNGARNGPMGGQFQQVDWRGHGWGGWGRHGGDDDMRGGPMGGPGRHGGFGPMRMEGALHDIGASDEQINQIESIMIDTFKDVMPAARDFRGAREDLAKLLGAETVDADAVEKLRSEKVAELDQVSQKVTKALVDAAKVLTPQQRADLMKQMQDHSRGPRW